MLPGFVPPHYRERSFLPNSIFRIVFIIFNCVYVVVCVSECWSPWRSEALDPLELELQEVVSAQHVLFVRLSTR